MSKRHNATIDPDSMDQPMDRGGASSGGNRGASSQKKKREMTPTNFWHCMFTAGVFKRQQGRITRQATFGVIAAFIAIGCWRLSQALVMYGTGLRFGVPLAVLAIGLWFTYRLVNYPAFADFLIGVEAEMSKVSWPTRSELIRSSVVVMITIFGLAIVLATYDFVLHFIFVELGVIAR